MGRWLALATCWLATVVSLCAGGVRYGMTRDEVVAALGKPTAELTRGPRLILRYPRNGTVELEKGVVVRLSGVPIDDGTAPPTTTVLPRDEEAFTLDDLATDQAKPPALDLPRIGTQDLVAVTEQIEANRNQELRALVPSPLFFWSGLLVGMVVRSLVTVLALKFAFKWCDVHADWIQMIIPALADAGSQALINGAAFALWHVSQLYYVDVGISYFVLIGVLMKTTHACTLQRAVGVATAAKFASFMVWILISAALLSLMVPSPGH